MPVISIDHDDLVSLLGMDIPINELVEKIPMIGAEIERVEGNQIDIEFFPNRPDLYSIEGVARALKGFLGIKTGSREYVARSSKTSIIVEDSVKNVRPYIAGGIIRNLDATDPLIKSLMDMQEKLHLTLGRKRKKVAIGVHDLSKIKSPFTYKAIDPTRIKFVPLGKTREMDLSEVLKKHEKGMEYSYILKDTNKYPIILDSNNEVLSFPPIINARLTTVTKETKNFFIEVTGTDPNAINTTLNIVSTAMTERGGKLYSIKVKYRDRVINTPNLKPKSKKLNIDYVNKILGTNLTPKDITQYLQKMMYGTRASGKDIIVSIPPYRNDILHPIDLVEDVAIGIGYQNLGEILPRAMTFGKGRKVEEYCNTLREIMIGLGYNEVTTPTLTSEKEQFQKMNLLKGDRVRIKNPITLDYTCLRVSLIPSLLTVLKNNKHHDLPQKIFEVGDVVIDNKNTRMLASVAIHAKASFTEAKSLAENILKAIDTPYKILPREHKSFIRGRCAAIQRNNREIGFFGEIHPQVITNFELGYPIIAFEITTQ